jgi:hypothetical protein
MVPMKGYDAVELHSGTTRHDSNPGAGPFKNK